MSAASNSGSEVPPLTKAAVSAIENLVDERDNSKRDDSVGPSRWTGDLGALKAARASLAAEEAKAVEALGLRPVKGTLTNTRSEQSSNEKPSQGSQ